MALFYQAPRGLASFEERYDVKHTTDNKIRGTYYFGLCVCYNGSLLCRGVMQTFSARVWRVIEIGLFVSTSAEGKHKSKILFSSIHSNVFGVMDNLLG